MMKHQTIRRMSIASLAWSLIALVSHSIAMPVTGTVVMTIAQRQPLEDQAQRIACGGALDGMAIAAGVVALILAVLAARRETPQMRVLVLVVALIANVWNFVMV